MTIIFLGCLEETRDTLAHLVSKGTIPDHVVTISEEESARQRLTNYVDMTAVAAAYGIPSSLVATYTMKSQDDVDLLHGLHPTVLLVVGWQRLVPENILQLVDVATIGFHGSANVLPWGRGRSPINWSIIEGRDRFALHMFLIRPGVDDGDIVGIKIYDINQWDTCRSVYQKTALAQAELIDLHLPDILSGDLTALPQKGEAFHYPKRTPEDGRIDWTADAESICRLVRAVTRPYPGARSSFDGRDILIWRAQPFSRDFFEGATPGAICFIAHGGSGEFVVACGRGSVLVTDSTSDVSAFEIGDVLQ